MKYTESSNRVRLNLAHFKKILLAKREEVEKELDKLKDKIANIEAAEKEYYRYVPEHQQRIRKRKETGISAIEINHIIYEQARRYHQQINDALDRIEDGTYGICQETWRPIPFKQLEAVPHTPYRLESKNGILSGGEHDFE